MHKIEIKMALDLMRLKKLSEFATIPIRGSIHAAGFDLSSAYDSVVPARGKALIKTDLAIAIPEGTYGRVGNCLLSIFYIICLAYYV